MKTYRFTVARTTVVHAYVYIDGTDEASARARFQHQLETRTCPGIEDMEEWGEAEYEQVHRADPYDHEYLIVDCEELDDPGCCCDNCAAPLPNTTDRIVVSELPKDIASANAGESAVICTKCNKEITP